MAGTGEQGETTRALCEIARALAAGGARGEVLRRVEETLAAAFGGAVRVRIETGPATAGAPARCLPLAAGGREYGSLVVEGAVAGGDRAVFEAVAGLVGLAMHAGHQERLAAEAAGLREQFLAIVSHELRTPLHAILGYLEVLEIQLGPGEGNGELKEGLERLRANAVRLNDLVQQIILFAELRAGRRFVNPAPVRLDRLGEQLGDAARDWAGPKPIDVFVEIDPEVREIVSDGPRLRQVLVCLLDNAVKFTERGRVRLCARPCGPERVEILVEDTGIGIAPADREKIFDDFRQIDGSVTRRFGGVGIGLALARDLTRTLGGTLDLESELGAGTRVRVCLPRKLDQSVTAALVLGGRRAGTGAPPSP